MGNLGNMNIPDSVWGIDAKGYTQHAILYITFVHLGILVSMERSSWNQMPKADFLLQSLMSDKDNHPFKRLFYFFSTSLVYLRSLRHANHSSHQWLQLQSLRDFTLGRTLMAFEKSATAILTVVAVTYTLNRQKRTTL